MLLTLLEIGLGMEHLHDMNLVHGDLKVRPTAEQEIADHAVQCCAVLRP